MADNWWNQIGRRFDQAQKMFQGSPSGPRVSFPDKNYGGGQPTSSGSSSGDNPYSYAWSQGAKALSGLMRMRRSRRGRGR